ncbi:ethanolamine ammonia-lyase subunit EutC [Andreprevotia chitinilytica]|uniref:ethanolamine ammonia-lyase subunit EutC n=1 Tax=Andreprevotia chitinilytica TaxID=396808 RepID=UPI00068C6326|nr:ethanolamine ammonia-lyase subunit EutC [Andreprevotia chitinilytica]
MSAMMDEEKPALTPDPWAELSRHTAARIALGRCGGSLPTAETLGFALAHAQARDAVHTPLDVGALSDALEEAGFVALPAHSRAHDRTEYLQRPDFGRRLDPASRNALADLPKMPCDILFTIGDGLSSRAIERNALPLLIELRPYLETSGWRIGPVVVAKQARVALADEVGELFKPTIVVMLIGERPGLSSPDSMGIYITHGPRVGRMDSERNCISNVRPEGLDYPAAARKLAWLLDASRRLGLTGVGLKDESDGSALAAAESRLAIAVE